MSQDKGSIVITGANGGLGSAIVSRIVASKQWNAADLFGIYTVRNPKTATALNSTLSKATKHQYEVVPLDLSSLSKVRESAANINAKIESGAIPRIKVLILNAGVQEAATQSFTDDGFDTTWQCNYLSHFLFTLLLLKSMDKEHGRILVVSSWSHDTADPRNEKSAVTKGMFAPPWNEPIKLDVGIEPLAKGTYSTPKDDPSIKSGYRRYGAAKLCEAMFLLELQDRLDRDPELSQISVLGMDPGGMPTGMSRHMSFGARAASAVIVPAIARIGQRLKPNPDLRTAAKSAADAMRACFDTKEPIGSHPKRVYLDGSVPRDIGKEARDEAKRSQLWEASVEYAALEEGDTALQNWQ